MAAIRIVTTISAPIERCFDLARNIDFHIRSLAVTAERAVAGKTTGLIGLGESVTWEARHLGIRQRLTSKITEFDRPKYFRDVMTAGAFKSFAHDHRFESLDGTTTMTDDVDFQSPFGPVGALIDYLFMTGYMRRLLEGRCQAIKREAESGNGNASIPDPKLEVRPAGAKGRGVFANEPIAAGRRIMALGGRLLPTAALTDDLLALQVGPDLWLCSDGSLLDDLVNHSCVPNAGFLDGETVLFALREIEVGEEICWDYSTSISEIGWTLECRCGSSRCRGLVRSWGELTADDRERLRGQTLRYLREP